MNYDLAIMALEGLARSPITVRSESGAVVIEASSQSFKELARLCLLLGGVQSAEDEFELQQGVHVSNASAALKLRLASS
jgi:hypothetical protein